MLFKYLTAAVWISSVSFAAADPGPSTTLCLKVKDKKNAGSTGDIRLRGYYTDNNGPDYEYTCTINGISRGETKCCTATQEDNYSIAIGGTSGKSFEVKLSTNRNDGLDITKVTFAGKSWDSFDGSTTGCDRCVEWPNCSGCNRDDCLRIDEPYFQLDGNGSPKCITALIHNSGLVCCTNKG